MRHPYAVRIAQQQQLLVARAPEEIEGAVFGILKGNFRLCRPLKQQRLIGQPIEADSVRILLKMQRKQEISGVKIARYLENPRECFAYAALKQNGLISGELNAGKLQRFVRFGCHIQGIALMKKAVHLSMELRE